MLLMALEDLQAGLQQVLQFCVIGRWNQLGLKCTVDGLMVGDLIGNVGLRTQAVVTKMDIDPEKRWVSRVWYKRPDGTLDRASGRIVVLAANGIENLRILLSSNAATSSDRVGRYLMDHPIKQSFALAPKAAVSLSRSANHV
jgi:choline dehydrogenase-like flavoprotein